MACVILIKSYRIVMGALVFGPIGAIAERLGASLILAAVRSFSGVRPLMDLEVFQSRKRFVASAKLKIKHTTCHLIDLSRITFATHQQTHVSSRDDEKLTIADTRYTIKPKLKTSQLCVQRL